MDRPKQIFFIPIQIKHLLNILFCLLDADGIPAMRLEEIAERASDLAYGKQDKGPYQSFRLVRQSPGLSILGCVHTRGQFHKA